MTKRPPKAGGLFKAMGHTPKPVAIRKADGSYEKVAEKPRADHEFEKTPPDVTRFLLAHEEEHLAQYPVLWEPAAGDGAMVKVLRESGFECYASDLVDRGCKAEIRSFYAFETAPAQALVTNPPFAECNKHKNAAWLHHACSLDDLSYMALLLPYNWDVPPSRCAVFAKWPIARKWRVPWRIDFDGRRNQTQDHAWFIFDRRYVGPTLNLYGHSADIRQKTVAL